MYIIKTISKSKKDSTQNYYTYRLMESTRIGKKVKFAIPSNISNDAKKIYKLMDIPISSTPYMLSSA